MFEPTVSRIKAIARNIMPSVFTDGNETDAYFDNIGRIVTRPYQIRGLVTTASATLSTGTVTSLLAGSSDVFHDLYEMTMSNDSSAAVQVLLEDDGTAVRNFELPATSISQFQFLVGLPQSSTGSVWELDLPDITGTTVRVYATFIKNR